MGIVKELAPQLIPAIPAILQGAQKGGVHDGGNGSPALLLPAQPGAGRETKPVLRPAVAESDLLTAKRTSSGLPAEHGETWTLACPLCGVGCGTSRFAR